MSCLHVSSVTIQKHGRPIEASRQRSASCPAPGSLVGRFVLEFVGWLQQWIVVGLEGPWFGNGGWGQDEGPLLKAKHNGCCLANYYVVLSDVPLEQKPFDRCTGNTKGCLWQRGSAFAFFEVAADLASVIIWPTMPGK